MTATMDRTREDVMQAIERIAPVIEQHRDEGEQIRRLPDATMAAMRDAGLLRLWTPKEYGGDEVDLPVFMAAVEKAAELDSAAGWVMSTAAGGPLLTAFMPAAVAHELFAAGPDVPMPGASAPNGRAVPVEGGYRVTGRWPLASGAHHGDWLGGMALIFDGEVPRMDAHGVPDFQSVLFRREDCEILDTWDSLGMRGTGSNHYTVNDVFVPVDRTFSVFTAPPQVSGPLYKLGVLPMFAMSVTSVLPGIARAAIDSFVEMAKAKTPTFSQNGLGTRPTIHAEVARVEAIVQSARAYLYEVAEEMMASVKAGEQVSEATEVRRRLACSNVGTACIEAVDRLFALAGATPIYTGHRLERCLRDIHTAGQHLFVSPVWWEKTGQYYFGQGLGMP